MEPAGEYRVVEYDGVFKIQKSVHVWDSFSSIFYKTLVHKWYDVTDDGLATRYCFEKGWSNGKPCETFNTLKSAKEKISIMKCGEIIHNI